MVCDTEMTQTTGSPLAVQNEQVLARQLSALQQAMMALGGAIGTGLFLASGLAVNIAGPAITLTYLLVAVIALLLGSALAEMAVAHPTAGAFGVYAEIYVSPFAGYAVRVSYWLMEVVATGGPVDRRVDLHGVLVSVDSGSSMGARLCGRADRRQRSSGRPARHGRIDARADQDCRSRAVRCRRNVDPVRSDRWPAIGLRHLTDRGGFMPFGISGVWLGSCFVIYSFIGVEIVGVTSGEAADPSRTIPTAMRRMVIGLVGHLHRHDHAAGCTDPVERTRGRGEPVRQRVKTAADSIRSGCDELRGVERSAVERQRKSLHHDPHDVFAGSRWLHPARSG
jgi:hypothetical protein